MQQHLNTFHTFIPLFIHVHMPHRKCMKIFINTTGRSKQLTSINGITRRQFGIIRRWISIALKPFQIRNKACVGLWFSTTPPWIRNLFLWIHQSLSPPSPIRESGATCNMKPRLAIKFPIPYKWRSNVLPPGQEKASNARSMPRGMLKLRFDWYINAYTFTDRH